MERLLILLSAIKGICIISLLDLGILRKGLGREFIVLMRNEGVGFMSRRQSSFI